MAVGIPALPHLIRKCGAEMGLPSNDSSHGLRKIGAVVSACHNGEPVPLLMVAYRHAPEAQTFGCLTTQPNKFSAVHQLEL